MRHVSPMQASLVNREPMTRRGTGAHESIVTYRSVFGFPEYALREVMGRFLGECRSCSERRT